MSRVKTYEVELSVGIRKVLGLDDPSNVPDGVEILKSTKKALWIRGTEDGLYRLKKECSEYGKNHPVILDSNPGWYLKSARAAERVLDGFLNSLPPPE